jgi:uncharacterized membrane protein
MAAQTLWQSIEYSGFGQYLASSEWAFPTLETIHVIALVTVFGTIAIMDLRLIGLTSKDTPVTAMSRETLWLTWGAFVLALMTGSLLFVSKATSYTINPYFLAKMGLIVLAGINMMVFHILTWKTVAQWDSSPKVPTMAKVAGFSSLALWITIVFCGRVIGFTLGIYFPT